MVEKVIKEEYRPKVTKKEYRQLARGLKKCPFLYIYLIFARFDYENRKEL